MSTLFVHTRVRLVGLMLLLLGTVNLVSAHARLVRSEPAADSTVTTSPRQVVLYFSEALAADGTNTVVVLDASGAQVSAGAAQMRATDTTAMQVPLQPSLTAGWYTVQWKNMSIDGDAAEGAYRFQVAAPGAPAPAPVTQLPQTGAEAPGTRVSGLGLLGLALLLAGLGMSLRGRRRRA